MSGTWAEEYLRSLAKWAGVPEDAPLLGIACEVSAVLESRETMSEPEYEYLVRSHYKPLSRTIESGPMNEETARIIAADEKPAGYVRELLRRRKASPWEPVPAPGSE